MCTQDKTHLHSSHLQEIASISIHNYHWRHLWWPNYIPPLCIYTDLQQETWDDPNTGFRHWWYLGQPWQSRKPILKNIYLQIRCSLKAGSTNNLSQAPMLVIKVKFDQSVEGKHWDRRQPAMKVLSVHEMTLYNTQHSSTSTSSARMNESARVGVAPLPRSPSSLPNGRLWTAGLNLFAPRWLYVETELWFFYLNHSEGDREC